MLSAGPSVSVGNFPMGKEMGELRQGLGNKTMDSNCLQKICRSRTLEPLGSRALKGGSKVGSSIGCGRRKVSPWVPNT